MNKELRVGGVVIYCDQVGNDHDAVLTAVWSHGTVDEHIKAYGDYPLVNLVFVSGDESKQDSYGRQIERATSVQHVAPNLPHGFYWRFPDEDRQPYTPPMK